jgi:hypothetical protein
MTALWNETVVGPLERLLVERAGEKREDIRPVDVWPFVRRVPA